VINKDSLAPGGHYGAVLATVRSDEKVNQPMVGVNQSLATLIYVLKNGGEKADLEFKSLEYNKNVFYFPKMVNLRFGNNGNVHVVPRGKMEITNSKGEIIAKGIVNADSGKILPESFRVLQTSIKRIKVWNWPGVYNLKLDYRYDGVDNFSEVKTKLVYVGFEGAIIVVGLAGITALVTVLILRRKRR
jgi:hypothetical protein